MAKIGDSTMKILAFGVRQGTGKSTATKIICGELRFQHKGINILQANFADKLKQLSYDLFGWAGLKPGFYYEENHLLKNEIIPKLNKTPRDIWIAVGNNMRAIYAPIWIECLLNTTIKSDLLIVGDLRFPNEANSILDVGGKIYRIDRDCLEKHQDGADNNLDDYEKWTGIIKNNGTLQEFHKSIVALIPELEIA